MSDEISEPGQFTILWPEDIDDVNTSAPQSNEPIEPPKPLPISKVEEVSMPEAPKKKRKKYCNKVIIKDGELKKCREDFHDCQYHICKTCIEEHKTSDECTHVDTFNHDIGPPKFNKKYASNHLYNLQFATYITLETTLNRLDSKYQLNGLTQKLEDKKEAYKEVFEQMYEEYGAEYLDSILSPVMAWTLLTVSDFSSSALESYANQEKKK